MKKQIRDDVPFRILIKPALNYHGKTWKEIGTVTSIKHSRNAKKTSPELRKENIPGTTYPGNGICESFA